ncbi:hypothetical protein [Streptomyces sparsogenes]|uniref:hypothetical protein n=1 Tax=Streptomyces sparsogenes TaxID=67365 RepID=UPI002010F208|nr:hypothetical protein [Streptomyces sparsogenes]
MRDGSLSGLRPGTVAVGADRARSLGARPGSTVTLRFGDGAEAKLRVVATYERALALGDFLLSRDELLRHTSTPRGRAGSWSPPGPAPTAPRSPRRWRRRSPGPG